MGIYPRVIAVDTVITWDHVFQRLPRGQVIDVPPGSALEAAIGLDRLVPLAAVTPQLPTAVSDGPIASRSDPPGRDYVPGEPLPKPEPRKRIRQPARARQSGDRDGS